MDLRQKIKLIKSICKRYIISKVDQEQKAGLSKLIKAYIDKMELFNFTKLFSYMTKILFII